MYNYKQNVTVVLCDTPQCPTVIHTKNHASPQWALVVTELHELKRLLFKLVMSFRWQFLCYPSPSLSTL